ncbi:hypothetical protein AB1L07_11150 [Niallia alba]|uniref:hypothetical protein n=1 Tax=Niallia alba TaxID=2729105 RepID=UPI002E1A7EA6|nr:hypothetical protein [Niallia alba]
MKKIKLLVPILVVCFFSTIFQDVQASPLSSGKENNGIISQKKEITNIEELYERAKNGITDIPIEEIEKSNILTELEIQKEDTSTNKLQKMIISEQEDMEIVEEVSTAQVLRTIKNGNTTSQEIALTSFTTLAYGTLEDSATDTTKSVRAYSTITYRTEKINGSNCILMTYTRGGWTILDNSVSISNRKVNFGTSGPSSVNGVLKNQTSDKAPTTNSFGYSVPNTWIPIVKDGGYTSCGTTQTVTLKRGSSTWTFKMINRVV